MKAVVLHGPNKISVEDIPVPQVGENDVLVKVHACGICGTDVHIMHGTHIVKFPVIPGHEFSGEIVETGKNVTGLKIGDRVTVDPNIVDNTCYFCRRGAINLCENLSAIGVNYNGGFAEYCKVPAVQAYKIPDTLSLDEAVMAEPLACCLHGIRRANILPGDSVVILGAGSIGLLLIQLARISGASPIIVSEPDEQNRRMAAKLGADIQLNPFEQDVLSEVMALTGVGADVVIESAGKVETAQLAIKIARRGGKVLQFGVVSPDKLAQISPYDVYYKELTVSGSFVNPFTHSRAVKLLETRQVEVMPLVTHRFPLDDAAKAMELAQGKEAIKILLVP
ncbi:MAG: zinc-dependent alcohol dehydrogenase family protein [Armatimonadota bacterium]